MTAIDNIRRDLQTASYLRYSPVPFAGAIHDFAKPMRKRFESRQHVGPYYMTPCQPGGGRSFYQSSKGLACGDGFFDLRLEEANEHLRESRLSHIDGYFTDEHCDSSLQPIVARLAHGRGYLPGWTMGNGMAASIELTIYEDIRDAAYAAHAMAESDAEKEREYQATQSDDSNEDSED